MGCNMMDETFYKEKVPKAHFKYANILIAPCLLGVSWNIQESSASIGKSVQEGNDLKNLRPPQPSRCISYQVTSIP